MQDRIVNSDMALSRTVSITKADTIVRSKNYAHRT